MKRQNSFLSSSSQIEISSDNLRRSKSFGCVSGLLHFLSNNQSRRNKSITFVHNNNQELHDAISETKSSPIRIVPQNASSDSRRISGQIPELERSESLISTEENFRGARGPIVRLMGLESCAATAATEKQRQVMDALEKCEQDLKALKDFIDSFESAPAESFRSSSPAGAGKGIELFSGGSYRDSMNWEQQQQPSPVSVLEEISRPRRFGNVHCCHSLFSDRPSANSGITMQQIQRKKAGEEDIFKLSKFERIEVVVGNFNFLKGEKPVESPFCSSKKAMRDSVEGVCKDIAWGQNREVGRIGLALQHHICGELIEELVKDLKFCSTFNYSSLPFEACKRRLCL